MTESIPCPFCDNNSPREHQVGARFHLSCPKCGALGPNKRSMHTARNAWNGRKGQAETAGPLGPGVSSDTLRQRFYAYFDRLIRKGTYSRLSGTDVAILEIFTEWMAKRYIVKEKEKRRKV